MIILTYVDDCILIANKKETLDQFIHSLANGIEKFEFADEGAIDKYMGVEIEVLALWTQTVKRQLVLLCEERT